MPVAGEWILMIANAIGHFMAMELVHIRQYLLVSAPLYAFVPVITVVLFGRLVRRRVVEGSNQ